MKEYWLDDWARAYKSILELRENTKHGPIIHVIEKIAYDQVVAERDSYKDDYDVVIRQREAAIKREISEGQDRDEWRFKAQQLTKERDTLKAALAYADGLFTGLDSAQFHQENREHIGLAVHGVCNQWLQMCRLSQTTKGEKE